MITSKQFWLQSHYWQYRLYRRLNPCTPDNTRENEKETVAPVRVESFDLKDIRLLPSRFRDNMLRDSAWMTSIDVNRLLHSFRTNAGVFAGREGGIYDSEETRWLGILGL